MKDGIFLGVLCLSGWLTFAMRLPRQYHYVDQSMTWTQARSYCRGSFLDIATIESPEEMNQLVNTLPSDASQVWIGLYHEIRWKWSDGYTGTGADYRKWASKEPNFSAASQFCVFITERGLWYDHGCHKIFPFICYNGSMLDPHFVTEARNWSAAQSYCREHFTDLATVRNDHDNLRIQNLMPPTRVEAWIGLSREPRFNWSDGSVFSFSYRQDGIIPLGSLEVICGVADMGISGSWWLKPCTEKRPFVCYSFPVAAVKRQMVKLRMKLDSSVDPRDPAVKADILKKLQDRAEEGGLSGATLRWREQPDGHVFHQEEKTPENKGAKKRGRSEL